MLRNAVMEIVNFWKRQRRNWRVIVTRAVLNRFFNQLTLDYTNIYVLKLGANPVQLGLVNGSAGISGTFIAAPLGWLQDRYSLRKIYLVGVGLLTIAPLIYAFASDWTMIIPAIMLSQLAMRGSMATCGTICDVSLESRDRATGRALCESIGSIPSLFAPLVAAFLITIFGGIGVDSIRPLYLIQFVGFCGMFTLAVTQLAEVKRKMRKGKSTFLGDFREVFDRGIAPKRFLLLFSLWNFIISMATPFKIPFAHQIKGVEQLIIGAMATSKILVPVVFATPIGKLSDRIGRKKIFYFLIPLLCASNLALILASTSEGLIISALLSGFEGIVSMTVLFSMLPELVPEDCIGRWRGLIYMFRGLASIPAPILGGFIWESVGPSFIFLITIGVYLLLIPIISTIPETLKT